MKTDVLNKNTAKKQPGEAKPSVVLNVVEVKPYNRREQSVTNWRSAVKSAEAINPRRNLLYDLYADVVQDGHVIAVTEKRFDAVTLANWHFIDKDGKPVDEINNIIDSVGFDEVVKEILNSRFWGYTIMEPTFWKNHDDKWEVAANLLPRLNYRPERGFVVYHPNTDEGINIREGIYLQTVMEVGNPRDLGLLLSAAQYAILKRGGLGDWAMFVQVFGRPIIDATWDGFDETQRQKLSESLNIGAGGVIVRPDGTAVNILESKGNQTTIHPDFAKFLNKEISKALLGTTETVESSDSTGYSQARTHDNEDDDKHLSDISFVRKMLNSRFTRVLKAHGLDTKGGSFIIQGEETKLSTKESFEMHKSMITELGLPIDDDFFYDTYGVPKPENYDAIKKEREAMAKQINPKKSKGKKPDDEDLEDIDETDDKNDKQNLSFLKKLLRFFGVAPAEMTGAIPGHLHTIDLALDDHWPEELFLNRIYANKGKLIFDAELFKYTVKTLLKGFEKGWKKEGISLTWDPTFEYDADDPALLTAFEQNLFRFAGAKTLAEVQALNELFRNSSSFNEFYEQAFALAGTYNKDWLLTEYNTAILTGEAASTYNRLIAQADIFPYWEYKTVGDGHVRATHQLMEGVILPASDERWSQIFPPNGWNCRCWVVPRLRNEFDSSKLNQMRARADAYIKSPDFAKEKAQGWGVNRGAIGEVFTANQQYVHKFPGMSSKLINRLGASDFDLLQYSQAKKVATAEMPKFEQSVAEWFDALEVYNNKPVLRDYNKRPMVINKTDFMRHVAKKDDRGKLIAGLQDSLINPDEIWLNGKELEDLVYIKYYKDQTLVAIGNVNNGKLTLGTWFNLFESKTTINKYRRGLLVYSKY